MPNPLVQKLRASAPARRDKSTVRVKWLGDTPWANESQVTIRMFVRFKLFVYDLKSFDLTKDLPLLQFSYIYFPEKSFMTMHIYLTKNTTGSIYFQWMKLGWHCDLSWASSQGATSRISQAMEKQRVTKSDWNGSVFYTIFVGNPTKMIQPQFFSYAYFDDVSFQQVINMIP